MANIKNLKPLSSTEARENGRKGGIQSGKARRKKAELRVLAQELLSLETVIKVDGEPQTVTHGMALVLALLAKAENPKNSQSVAAAKTLISLTGADKLKEEIELIRAQAALTSAKAKAIQSLKDNNSGDILDEILKEMRDAAESQTN